MKAKHEFTSEQEWLTYLRTYFAAMAPSIPDWFKHDEPARINNLPDWQKIENDEDREIVRQWVADGIFDLPEHLMWFQIATDLAQKDHQRCIIENNISRYFQWRTFYADHLIAELNKPTTNE